MLQLLFYDTVEFPFFKIGPHHIHYTRRLSLRMTTYGSLRIKFILQCPSVMRLYYFQVLKRYPLLRG